MCNSSNPTQENESQKYKEEQSTTRSTFHSSDIRRFPRLIALITVSLLGFAFSLRQRETEQTHNNSKLNCLQRKYLDTYLHHQMAQINNLWSKLGKYFRLFRIWIRSLFDREVRRLIFKITVPKHFMVYYSVVKKIFFLNKETEKRWID